MDDTEAWHGGRRRAALIAVVAMAIARLAACGGGAGPPEPGVLTAHPTGHAFADQSGIVTTAPVASGSFVTFGSTLLRNTSGGPVTLLRAEPVWVEHVEVANLGVSPYGPTVPISELDVHAVDAVPLRAFVVPPSAGETDELYGITLELRLDPSSVAGILVGLDLEYRSNGKVEVQRFPIVNVVCRAEGTPCGPYFGIDVLRSDPERLLEDLAEDGTLSTTPLPPTEPRPQHCGAPSRRARCGASARGRPDAMTERAGIPRPGLLEHLRLASKAGDLAWALERLHQRFGRIVDFGYRVPQRAIVVFGPEANRHVLVDSPASYEWGSAMRLLEAVDGPTALVLSDGEEHRRRRRLVQPAFAIKRVDAQLELVVAEVDRTLHGWTPGRRLDAHDDLRAAIRRIVVRGLFGSQLGAVADEIGERLEPALEYVGRTPMGRIDVDLRWLPYGKAMRARAAVDELLLAEISRRRAAGVDAEANPDTLSALLAAADEAEGSDAPLTDAELCDQIRSLVAAGYDTTSSAAAWVVHALGAHPLAFAALREQVRDTIGDRPPTVDDLKAMPLVDGVVREVLRLWPPGLVGGRTAIEDAELFGHTIPAGSTVLYSPYVTHRLPEVWGDPLAFRPERWADGEPEPFSFVPFGGGYRRCIGFALATLELQVLAVRLAQRVEWTLDRPDVRGAGIATFAPRGGLPITVA